MRIMDSRLMHLNQALAGLERSGVPLVCVEGDVYTPAGRGDDAGIYYLFPKLSQWLGIPVDLALDAFYYTLIPLCVLAGAVGLACALRSGPGRAVAIAMLVWIGGFVVLWNDVYLISPALVMGLVPWLLWLVKRPRATAVYLALGLAVGLLASAGNLLRSHSGTGVILFGLVLVALAPHAASRQKLAFVLVLAAGFAVPAAYMRTLVSRRDAFLATKNPGYRAAEPQHAFWHPVYLGLGFLRNPYQLAYDDSCAMRAVAARDPQIQYLSPEYSATLKQLIVELYGRDATFFYRTIAAKLGILVYYLLRYANLGLLAAWLAPKGWRTDAAFAAGLAFSALFGVLVIPDEVYLLGYFAFAALFGAVSLGHLLDSRWRPQAPWFARLAEQLSQRLGDRPRTRRALGLAVQMAVVVLAVWYCGARIQRAQRAVAGVVRQSILDSRRPLLLTLERSGQVSHRYALGQFQWSQTAQAARLTAGPGGLELVTDEQPYAYQIEADFPLDEGTGAVARYELEVLDGGVAVGLLNTAGQWADIRFHHEPGVYRDELAAYAAGEEKCRLIVTNWNAQSRASRCRIDRLEMAICSDRPRSTVVAEREAGETKR